MCRFNAIFPLDPVALAYLRVSMSSRHLVHRHPSIESQFRHIRSTVDLVLADRHALTLQLRVLEVILLFVLFPAPAPHDNADEKTKQYEDSHNWTDDPESTDGVIPRLIPGI